MALITPWTGPDGNFVESLPLHVRGRVLCLLILFFAKSTKDHRKTLHWTDRLFLSLCHSWSSLFPMYLHDSDLRSSQSHVSYRLVKNHIYVVPLWIYGEFYFLAVTGFDGSLAYLFLDFWRVWLEKPVCDGFLVVGFWAWLCPVMLDVAQSFI